MYNLAKNRKAPKNFLCKILLMTFAAGCYGYYTANENRNEEFVEKTEYFKGECGKVSKLGLQIAKMCSGKNSWMTSEWKERNEDFEKWCCKNDIGRLVNPSI